MEQFLQALTPALRQEVELAVAEYGEEQLEQVVRNLIDEDGNWPTNPDTATYLAREFLEQNVTVGLEDEIPTVQREFTGAGIAPATATALAAGALSVGAAKGAVVLSSALMARYWTDVLAYSSGINPAIFRAMQRVFNQVSKNTRWEQLARDLTAPSGPTPWGAAFGDGYAQLLERELLGVFSQAAWRGARSAVAHFGGRLGNATQENPWVRNYLAAFAQTQTTLTEQTVRTIIDNALERRASPRVISGELQQLWSLSPQHAQAVENYRRGLLRQERSQRSIFELAGRYANRLQRSRAQAISKTEALTLFNLGRELKWQEAVRNGELPIDTVKMWVTAKDELVCKVCRPLDGETAELGRPFEGEITIMVPSVHPNCRCIIIPVRDTTSLGTTIDVSSMKEMVFTAEEVSKRTIIIPEYQRQDGTTVRRHTRVIGERDAMERWKGAEPTEEHAAIAKVMRNLRNDLWDSWFEGHRARPDPPESMKYVSEFDHWEDYNEWWRVWSTEGEGKTWWQEVKAVDRRQRAKREKEMIPKLEAVADPDLVKSIIRGSRIWSTQTGGIGLVRELAGLTAPNHIPSEDYNRRKWRESEIKAASDFLNTVRSAPLVNNRVFYRGIDIPHTGPFKKELKQSLKKIKPGQIIDLPVSSVTEKRHTAEAFMDMFERSKPSTRVLFKINKGSPSLRLPNPISNPLFEEHEWVVSGRFEIDSVEQQEKWGADFLYVTLNYAGDNVSKSVSDVIEEIESRLCTPLIPPETARLFDDDGVDKRLVRVSEYERTDGTSVRSHFRQLKDAAGIAFWDLTTRALSRGEFETRDEVVEMMRKRNKTASAPLRELRSGKIINFSTRQLGYMTEGVGFRVGNENHIKTFANRMLAGEDVFRHGRRRDPIMVLVYNDGAQVLDGKHRLAAAQMIGMKKVPIQIARIRKDMPQPTTFRQEWDEIRRNLVRWQYANKQLPKQRPAEPFDVRKPVKAELAINEWLATRSALRDEERFLELGVQRGVKPRRFQKGLAGLSTRRA